MNAEDREDGSGTVAVLGVLCVLVTLCLAGVHLARVEIDRTRAQTVVDLAALAGADAAATWEWEDVGERPCELAHEVLRRNGLVLDSCTQERGDVRVRARLEAGPGGTRHVRARAGTP